MSLLLIIILLFLIFGGGGYYGYRSGYWGGYTPAPGASAPHLLGIILLVLIIAVLFGLLGPWHHYGY